MVEEAVVGARGGGDQIGNGTRVANLAERGSGFTAGGGLILFDHAHQAVDRVAIARPAYGTRSRYANAEGGVLEGSANAPFSLLRADPIKPPHGRRAPLRRPRFFPPLPQVLP